MLQAVTLQSERPLKKLLTNSKRSTTHAQDHSSGDGARPPGAWAGSCPPRSRPEGKAEPRPGCSSKPASSHRAAAPHGPGTDPGSALVPPRRWQRSPPAPPGDNQGSAKMAQTLQRSFPRVESRAQHVAGAIELRTLPTPPNQPNLNFSKQLF